MAMTGQLATINSVLGVSVHLAYPSLFVDGACTATSTLALTSVADWTGPLPQENTGNTLALTDGAVVDLSVYGRKAVSVLDMDVETTSNIKELYAESTIELTQDNYQPATYVLYTESDMDMEHVWASFAEFHGTIRLDAESTITFDQDADHQIKGRSVTTSIELTQTATFSRVITAESTIVLTDAAFQGFVNLWAENIIELDHVGRSDLLVRYSETAITLDHAATSNIKMLEAETVIELAQSNNVMRPWRVSATSAISGAVYDYNPDTGFVEWMYWGFDDPDNNVAKVTLSNAHRNAEHIIQLQQEATKVFISATADDLDADNTIVLTQEAIAGLAEEASSVITLTHEATATTTELASNTLQLDHDVFLQAVLITPAVSELNLKQAVIAVKIDDTTLCDYDPSIGSNDDPDVPSPPRPVIPPPQVLSPTDRFKLVYPHFGLLTAGASLQEELILRAPHFGNREGVHVTRINRETRNGTLIIYRDPVWPEYFQLTLEFGVLSETQARRLLIFIESTLGLEIGIQDHEGRYWRGFITNPDSVIVQDGTCKYSASLQIEARQLVAQDMGVRSYIGVMQLASAVLN